jgi:hypothetical protein
LCYIKYINSAPENNMTNAFATYSIQNTTSNNRACRQGVIEVNSTSGDWFAFSVFGFTKDQIKESAYHQADLLSSHKGWTLQSLRAA